MVGGKQLTVAWHVDDLKVSHMDASAIQKFIQGMEQELSKETPFSISHQSAQLSWNEFRFHGTRACGYLNVRLCQYNVE